MNKAGDMLALVSSVLNHHYHDIDALSMTKRQFFFAHKIAVNYFYSSLIDYFASRDPGLSFAQTH